MNTSVLIDHNDRFQFNCKYSSSLNIFNETAPLRRIYWLTVDATLIYIEQVWLYCMMWNLKETRCALEEVQGIPLLERIAAHWDRVAAFQAFPQDLLIATYPKAGKTHWKVRKCYGYGCPNKGILLGASRRVKNVIYCNVISLCYRLYCYNGHRYLAPHTQTHTCI